MSDELNYSDWSDVNTTAHLDELPFLERSRHIYRGLFRPDCTGHRKWAEFQLRRSYAVVMALLVPALLAAMIAWIAAMIPARELVIYDSVKLMPKEDELPADDPLPVDPIEEPLLLPPETPQGEQMINKLVEAIARDASDYDDPPTEAPSIEDAPQTDTTVLLTASPVKFRMPVKVGVGQRSTRGPLLKKYGAPPHAESSVLLALRWLKKNQNTDGTWGKTKPAITSLALLTYLAHGETPASEEFGATVELAIRWLLENQAEDGRFSGSDNHEYSLPIAAYALSETFSMTSIPDVRYAAEKSIELIIKGQHPDGGWDYNCRQSQRNDTSYAGWCVQALKAARIARLNVDGLDEAISKAAEGLKRNYAGNSEYGGFGYTSGSQTHGLTSVGVLCLQILGKSDTPEVQRGLRTLAMEKFRFDLLNPGCGKNGLYYWYYTTQAMFHAGGETWNKWNRQFSNNLVSEQNIIPEERSEYVDHKGRARAIGFWDQYDGHGKEQGPAFATVLCALQLEVYYRYLPSFHTPEDHEGEFPIHGESDINIEIII